MVTAVCVDVAVVNTKGKGMTGECSFTQSGSVEHLSYEGTWTELWKAAGAHLALWVKGTCQCKGHESSAVRRTVRLREAK